MPSTGLVKSADRTIEILEYFRTRRRTCGLSEIAGDLRYPVSSTTVLLKTLVRRGYLNYDRVNRVYFPTPKVTSLGDWIPGSLFGSGAIVDLARDIHAETGEGVYLATANDIFIQYLVIIQPVSQNASVLHEGMTRLVTQTPAGWLLLSSMPDSAIDTVVRRANIAAGGREDRVAVSAIVERVAQIRASGHSYAEDTPVEGCASLAVLLPVELQTQPVALGVAGKATRLRQDRDRLVDLLRRTARRLAS